VYGTQNDSPEPSDIELSPEQWQVLTFMCLINFKNVLPNAIAVDSLDPKQFLFKI